MTHRFLRASTGTKKDSFLSKMAEFPQIFLLRKSRMTHRMTHQMTHAQGRAAIAYLLSLPGAGARQKNSFARFCLLSAATPSLQENGKRAAYILRTYLLTFKMQWI